MAELKADTQSVIARRGSGAPRTVFTVLAGLDEDLRTGQGKSFLPIPTGFQALDHSLGGGVRAGDLVLVGGSPGVGKTIVSLQWARNIALAGGTCIYACYEHEESALLGRLLALEMGDLPGDHSEYDTELDAMRLGIQEIAAGGQRKLQDGLHS